MRFLKELKSLGRGVTPLDFGVGVGVGASSPTIVNSWVKELNTPPLGLLLGGIDFSNFFVVLKGTGSYPTLKAAQDAGAVTLIYGLFINSVINFVIVAFAVFVLVRQINRLAKPAPAPEPPPPAEVQLLREIRDLLKAQQNRAS